MYYGYFFCIQNCYMNDTEINDKRSSKEFKGITFSKFQKSKVKKELLICISSAKVEAACYWSAELICAGQFSDLWEIIILFLSRHIHLGNPKLPIYIAMRFENFKKIVSDGFVDNELRLRNNPKIRHIFAEIISVLCFSRRKHCFEPIKIKKDDEFNMTHMASKLKAPSVSFANDVFKSADPKELYIACNEFAFHISSSSRNAVSACYWLEWILEYEAICKKRREKCSAERRSFAPVLDKYQMDPIWILWEIIFSECNAKNDKLVTKVISSLIEIYGIKYTSGVQKRRRFVIYFAIALLTEQVDMSINMLGDKEKTDAITKKIDIVYKDVKKNEEVPDTDYLFNGVGKSNLDKTIERLEAMNKIMGSMSGNN